MNTKTKTKTKIRESRVLCVYDLEYNLVSYVIPSFSLLLSVMSAARLSHYHPSSFCILTLQPPYYLGVRGGGEKERERDGKYER